MACNIVLIGLEVMSRMAAGWREFDDHGDDLMLHHSDLINMTGMKGCRLATANPALRILDDIRSK